jgi:hypothetical protein
LGCLKGLFILTIGYRGKYMLPTPTDRPCSWSSLLKANCNSLFQIALLLSADPEVAEASVIATIEAVDISCPPGQEELANLQQSVATKTLERLGAASRSHLPAAQSMLQAGLWPLLQVEQSARICFVLRVLLRCAISSSAQMLGIEEGDAKVLLQIALVQLCQASQEVIRPIQDDNLSTLPLPI